MEVDINVTIDPNVLEGYFRGNIKAREDFVSFFRTNLGNSLNLLRSAVESRNWREVEFLAHRMRGSVGYVGAYKVAAALQRLEDQAAAGNPQDIERLLSAVAASQDELMQCI